jgi:hypothetical protein
MRPTSSSAATRTRIVVYAQSWSRVGRPCPRRSIVPRRSPAFAGELVDAVQQFQRAAINCRANKSWSVYKAFGAIGHIGPTAAPTPRCGFLRFRYGTFSPSSRRRRCTRLLLILRSARRSAVAARRQPHRRRSLQNARSHVRSRLLRRRELVGRCVASSDTDQSRNTTAVSTTRTAGAASLRAGATVRD